MQGNTVRSFYESFDLEKAMERSSDAFKRLIAAEVEFLRKDMDRLGEILEIGCGFGRLLGTLAGGAIRVTGIDFSKRLLRKAETASEGRSNIDLHNMEAESLGFKDSSFHCTVCVNNTLGNMPGNEIKVLSEMKRVTKKGGRIIVSVFSDEAKDMQLENYSRMELKGIKDSGHAITTEEGLYSRRFTKDDLEHLFACVGLECSISQLCPENYIAIAER